LGQILRAAEGSLAPVGCLDCRRGTICPIVDTCSVIPVWRELGKVTAEYLDSKTLADLIRETEE
jgi:DNA-binding IscR family transcriptional regulator